MKINKECVLVLILGFFYCRATSQTLQQVTDAGATTTNRITVDRVVLGDGTITSAYNLFVGVNDDGTTFRNNSAIRGFNFKNKNAAGLDQTLVRITSGGYVGIGTISPTDRLTVNGTLRAKEVKVDAGPWPDYVFEPDYLLSKLPEVEQFIKVNKHLPGIPSQKEVSDNGIGLGRLNALLLEKIEELTLHLIEQNRIQAQQSAEIDKLKNDITELSGRLK